MHKYAYATVTSPVCDVPQALQLNPRSKTILIEKAKCHTELGMLDKALLDVDQAHARLKSGLHGVSSRQAQVWLAGGKLTPGSSS